MHDMKIREHRLGFLAECVCGWLSGFWDAREDAESMTEIHLEKETAA